MEEVGVLASRSVLGVEQRDAIAHGGGDGESGVGLAGAAGAGEGEAEPGGVLGSFLEDGHDPEGVEGVGKGRAFTRRQAWWPGRAGVKQRG